MISAKSTRKNINKIYREICTLLVGSDCVSRWLVTFDKIGVKDVELVTLNYLRRRIIEIIMGLVVLVPLIAGVNTIEKSRLSRSIFVSPQEDLNESN